MTRAVAMLLLVCTLMLGAGATAEARPLFGMNVPSLDALRDSESAIGARAAIVGLFADWVHDTDFPAGTARQINAHGAVPLISWEPWDSWIDEERDQPAFALRTIAAGEHDALIDRWAAQVAAYRRPVMLRFAAEMNGDWRPWASGVNGNRAEDYVAAWRHVRARFRSAGARNAIWVWNPIVTYDGSAPLRPLFPGARQVDWLAIDGYNWGPLHSSGWQSYREVFAPTIRRLRRLAPRRPIMIAETGSAPGRGKPRWVADAFARAREDGIGALVWFEFDKETDWRLAERPAVSRAAGRALGRWRTGGDLAAIERATSSAATRR
jgi:beta-mannanase